MIAEAFPDVERTKKWRLVHARSSLREALDQRRFITACVGFAVLLGAHDRQRLIGRIFGPRVFNGRITSTVRRSLGAKTV
jgi:hypothetical protein